LGMHGDLVRYTVQSSMQPHHTVPPCWIQSYLALLRFNLLGDQFEAAGKPPLMIPSLKAEMPALARSMALTEFDIGLTGADSNYDCFFNAALSRPGPVTKSMIRQASLRSSKLGP